MKEIINIWNKLLRKAIRGEHRRLQETPRLVSAERELVSIMGKQEGFTSFCKQSGYTEKDVFFFLLYTFYISTYFEIRS